MSVLQITPRSATVVIIYNKSDISTQTVISAVLLFHWKKHH